MDAAKVSVDFHNNVIMPYKGALEKWFISNNTIFTYFRAIYVTIWVYFFQNRKLCDPYLRGIPEPPQELKKALYYKKLITLNLLICFWDHYYDYRL